MYKMFLYLLQHNTSWNEEYKYNIIQKFKPIKVIYTFMEHKCTHQSCTVL